MTSPDRIQSFSEFWPYYIGEHRKPVCRALHFVGTGGFVAVLAYALSLDPVVMGACIAGGLMIAAFAVRIEKKRMAAPEALAIIALWMFGNPIVLAGVVWAYFFAWMAHFVIEGNRPATFKYPLRSFICDWIMWKDILTMRIPLFGELPAEHYSTGA